MQKVWTDCDMSKYCIWGAHDSAIIFWHIVVCSHFFAHCVCTFELCLNFSFEIHCGSWGGKVDFSMISLAFLLIFWTLCSDFAEVLPDKRLGPISQPHLGTRGGKAAPRSAPPRSPFHHIAASWTSLFYHTIYVWGLLLLSLQISSSLMAFR